MGWWKNIKEAHAPPDDVIETALWDTKYEWNDENSLDHLMTQYLKYLEMADNVSARRATANTFFLTLNTGVVATISTFGDLFFLGPAYLCIFLAALITLCLAWVFLLRSYRTLNTAKFRIVGMLETRLPASPFWAAEWQALKEGKDWIVHKPLTPVEIYVPLVFIWLYIALGVTTILD